MTESLGSLIQAPRGMPSGGGYNPTKEQRPETVLHHEDPIVTGSPVGWTLRAKVSGVVGLFEFPGAVSPTEALVFLRGIDQNAEFETELVYKRQWGEKKHGLLHQAIIEGRSGKVLVTAQGRAPDERMVKADTWLEPGKVWELLEPLQLLDHEIAGVRQAADGQDTAFLMRTDQGMRFEWLENERDGKMSRKLTGFEKGAENGSKAAGV